MNLIEAWKKARIGQKLECNGYSFYREDCPLLATLNRNITNSNDIKMLSDNWEIIKEKKIWEGTVDDIRYKNIVPRLIPGDATVTIEWEE